MAPTSMDELRRLKRVDLQALAKVRTVRPPSTPCADCGNEQENHIKANLRTDALVEALACVFQLYVVLKDVRHGGDC